MPFNLTIVCWGRCVHVSSRRIARSASFRTHDECDLINLGFWECYGGVVFAVFSDKVGRSSSG